MYASLLMSLLAAFVAMLGKQWLNRYLRHAGGSVIAVVVCDYSIAQRCYFFLFLFSFHFLFFSYFLFQSHDQEEDIYWWNSSGTLVSTTLATS